MIELKRGGVYQKDNGVKFIVLSFSNTGVVIAYIGKGMHWNNIRDLKIPGIGFARPETISTVPRDWLISGNPALIERISLQKFRKITGSIYDFLNGDIYETEDGLMYRSWHTRLQDAIFAQEKVDAIPSTIPDSSEETEEDEPMDENTEVDDSSTSENQSTKDDEEWYDLLQTEKKKTYEYTNADIAKGSRKKYDKSTHRSMFRKSEAMIIAASPINSIRQKYGVSRSIASVMKTNAKKLLGFNISGNTGGSGKYVQWFKEGYKPEDIYELFPNSKKSIDLSYTSYLLSLNRVSDMDSIYKEELKRIESMDILDLVDYYETQNAVELGEKLHITKEYSSSILYHIRTNILARNPYYIAGFTGKEAFDGSLHARIASLKDQTEKLKISDAIDVALYDAVKILYDSYVRSFDDHIKILSGEMMIPDYVPFAENYRALLKNRLNYRSNNRWSIIDCKQIIQMGISCNTALYCMNRYKAVINIVTMARRRIAKEKQPS